MDTSKDVVVLGPGCASCETLNKNTKKAMSNLNCEASYNYITDITVMASLGIISAPALMLNGKIISTGKTLTVSEVEKLLKENKLV